VGVNDGVDGVGIECICLMGDNDGGEVIGTGGGWISSVFTVIGKLYLGTIGIWLYTIGFGGDGSLGEGMEEKDGF
jgi:hypothetical protein